jgi:hypothetical protein
MPHGRFSCLLLAIPFSLSIGFASIAWADGFCGSDEITLSSRADTVFVGHANSLMSCCKELSVRVDVVDATISFYESDRNDPCRCWCCYDYTYLAAGFPAGRYDVFVYDAIGSHLFGEGTVDVEGSDGPPRILALGGGLCADPQATQARTWGEVRILFR